MDFAGESLVVDAGGDVIVKADDMEQIVLADVDMQMSKTVRKKRPYTTLRRPELYIPEDMVVSSYVGGKK